jgi:hypothetical protein
MYVTRRNAIHVPFSLCSNAKKVEECALLDSGATHNFMDSRMAKRLRIGTRALARPRSIINVDGTGNQAGTLTKYTDLSISYQGITEVQHFFITNLGEDRAIFGFPWFQTFNPKVDWKKAKIEGSAMVKTTREKLPQWAQISRMVLAARRIANKGQFEEGDEIHMCINKTNMAQQWAEKLLANQKNKLITEATIPTQYTEFADVFSESAARRFPPHREDDHAINFKPDAPDTFSCKIYPISFKETEFLREWVSENLDKRFIRESKSPYVSPTFLIKKKNGNYWVIQDYRTLNEHTIPDVSPLPLIGEIIGKLHGRTLFTKFDIRWGYHNI